MPWDWFSLRSKSIGSGAGVDAVSKPPAARGKPKTSAEAPT